jgi:hypothetical protein
MANNPAEQVHIQFQHWHLGARGSTHERILLLMQHWLKRTAQL